MIAYTIASLSRLKPIWRDKNISFASKAIAKLKQNLILSTSHCACDSRTGKKGRDPLDEILSKTFKYILQRS